MQYLTYLALQNASWQPCVIAAKVQIVINVVVLGTVCDNLLLYIRHLWIST